MVEDKIELNGSSTLNKNGSKNKVFTYYKGSEKVDFQNTLDFMGATVFNSSIYAKKANVVIGGSGGIQGSIITGGPNVTISGDASADTRAIYAPNADINMTGSGKVKGAIIGKNFTAGGATYVNYSNDFQLPDLSSQKPFTISWY